MRSSFAVRLFASFPLLAKEPEPFGLTKVLTVDIQLTAADYAAMQPPPATPVWSTQARWTRPPLARQPRFALATSASNSST